MGAPNEDSKIKGIPLKVLILEDRPADAELMLHELQVAGYNPTWQRVETEADYRQHLDPSLEIILADYNLPQFTGLQAIDILNETDLNIPLILVTGTIEETALECLKRGAVDYILKDRLGRLGPAVKKALEDKRIRENNKLAAEALRASEQRYRGVAETALTGLSIVDPDENITFSNPAFAKMLGYTNKELLGMSLKDLIDPEYFLEIKAQSERRKEGLSTQYEAKMKRKDGEVRTVIVSASPLTSKDGEYEGSQAVITDITERVQAENALGESEEKLRLMIDNSPIGFSATDMKGNYIDLNPVLCQMVGYSKGELISKNFSQISHPEDEEKNSELYKRLVNGEIAYFDLEKRYIHKNGDIIHVLIRAQLARNIDGEPLFEFAIVEDITERVQAERKVQHLNLILHTISKVNHLLVEGKNRDNLIRETCKILTENHGYYNAWIVLFDEKGDYLGAAESGLGDGFSPLKKKLEGGWLPLCGAQTLKSKNLVCIEDPPNQCGDCPLSKKYGGRSGFSIRLDYANKIYGLLTVSIPAFIMDTKEEQDLFTKIGADIGFALHNIEVDEKSKKDEAQLILQSLALESAANAIVIADAEGLIQWVNPAFSTLTGYSHEEALGRNPRILKSDHQDDKFYKNLWDTISSGEIWQGEIINKRADGELYTEEMTITPLLSEKNEISNYIAIKHDITDRVQAQAEIQQRTQDLTLINSINAAVNSGEDLPEILKLLTKKAKRVFGSKHTTVYLYSEDQNHLEMQNLALSPSLVKQIEKLIKTSIPDIRIPVEEGSLTQELLLADEPRLINESEIIQKWMLEFTYAIDLSEKSRLVIQKLISKIYKLVDIQSIITVPMISAGELIGLMDFSRREPFSEEDTKRVASIVGQVTAAITSLRAEKEKARSRDLLLTLSQAAPAVQQANTSGEIFRAIGEQVSKIGLDVTVFTLSDDKKHLVVSYQSLKKGLIRTIEKLTGLTARGYKFPLKTEGYFHKIITDNETVYSHLEIEPIEETLPKALRSHAKKIMSLFGRQQSIIAPLAVSGIVQGLLTISGSDLSESDKPAITAFANQAAIALEKTRLFQETEDLAAFNESIIQNMAEGIVLQNTDGVISFVNPAAAKMLDYTSEEWIGKHWTEIVPPDQQVIIQNADERRMRGESDHYELELVNKDSQRISVLVGGSPLFDGEGQFAGTMAVFTNITERKRAEEKISRFSQVFEGSLNEIYLFDSDTLKFTQVNTAGQNNIGYTMEELYELTPFDIKPEVTAKSFEYLIAPLRKNETDRVIFETVHKRKDGSLYNIEVHLQLMRYENEALFAAIILDITERYQAELESKRYIRRLDALLNIDQAIMSSFDLQLTLNVILEHLMTQLAIDAVAVLIYHSDLQTLNFAQGRGFQTPALQYTDLRLGEGYAGEVGLQRDHIFIPDLNQAEGKFRKSPQFSQEEFVSYYGIPLLAKGKLVGVLEIFNRSPLDPEDEWVNYLRLLAGQIAIAIDNISLFNDLQRTNIDLTLSYDATIEGWARALELKDMETEGHSRRVVEVTLALSKRMGISGEKLRHIRRGALLHDIGKMGIPDAILQKPGKLSDEEWQIMKQHPVYAYEWLSRIEYLRPALDIPYYHHEKWDGSGYPRGLEGEQIPLAARIFAIVDVWDALTSDRPYRKAWPVKKILDHIREQSGIHFDPSVVDAFVEQVTGK
ncbi:MAG: PAS domain S-box protein [Anaerolineales bacterium]